MEINDPIAKEVPELSPETENAGITREGIIGLVFALAMLAAAYLLVEIFPIMLNPLGSLILIVSIYAATTAAALLLGAKPDAFSFAALVLAVIGALYRMIHGYADFDLFPIIVIEALLYAYYSVTLFSNHSRSMGGGLLLDLVKGITYLFASFHEFFAAIFKPRGAKKRRHTGLLVLGGVLITAAVVVAVAALLSYDSHFKALLPNIDLEDVFEIVFKIGCAIPIAAMLFGAVMSSLKRKFPKLSEAESVNRVGSKVKVVAPILVIMPIAALLIVYALFFISQWGYYVSAFTHTLPENYSAAEYAREGFFQLLAVTLINLVMIALAGCFMKETTKATGAIKRILMITLSAATLVLIATAVAKMLLYIDTYDLTRLRLFTTAFMVFLAVIFITVIISAIFKKVKVLPVVVAAAVLFFAAYSLVNTNRVIAKYNVDSYLSGKHDSIDVDYLRHDLGWSSAPELKRLAEEATGGVKTRAEEAYRDMRSSIRHVEWYEADIPYYEAKKTFEDK
ncbi:MAG: DUF4173 domain-containing protein [Clostridia bacterium]|nr:DUF4173 domain-containing protein [Clostridia bacterium]